MKGLRDKMYELKVFCYSLSSLRALRHLGEHCVFVFRTMNGILCVKSQKKISWLMRILGTLFPEIITVNNWTIEPNQ